MIFGTQKGRTREKWLVLDQILAANSPQFCKYFAFNAFNTHQISFYNVLWVLGFPKNVVVCQESAGNIFYWQKHIVMAIFSRFGMILMWDHKIAQLMPKKLCFCKCDALLCRVQENFWGGYIHRHECLKSSLGSQLSAEANGVVSWRTHPFLLQKT